MNNCSESPGHSRGFFCRRAKRRQKCRRVTHECVRHYTENVKPLSNYALLAAAILLAVGCTSAPLAKPPAFDATAEEFVYGTLALSPVSATGAGYHVHQGTKLDEMLDDYSAAGDRKSVV